MIGDDSALAHHNGMRRMIDLRGGIDTLSRAIAHQASR